MKRTLSYLSVTTFLSLAPATAAIHVSTSGNDQNEGSAEAPFGTIHHAVEVVQPGDTIWVHGGTYAISERIKIPEKKTSPTQHICLWVTDVSLMGQPVTGEYRGLVIRNRKVCIVR